MTVLVSCTAENPVIRGNSSPLILTVYPGCGRQSSWVAIPRNTAVTGTVDGTSVTGSVTDGTVTGTVTSDGSGSASVTADMPITFGHNIPELDASGKPVGGYDDYFGAVCLGYEFEGDADKLKVLWKSTFALYMSAKLFTFEGSTQIG